MTDNNKLMQEYWAAFGEAKRITGFESDINELEENFMISDMVLNEMFVSKYFSRSVCRRICDFFGAWSNYFHRLLMPNPSSIVDLKESKVLTHEDKENLTKSFNLMMELCSRNSVISLVKDKKAEGEFIDECLNAWKNEIKPNLTVMAEKVNDMWKAERNAAPKKEEKKSYGGVI